ncbi:MAG: hypothetical protein RLZZ292_969 [Bacteroidota bacterium]|jgi:hypothetical protein
MRISISLTFLLSILLSTAAMAQKEDEKAILIVVQNVFDALRSGDTVKLRSTFAEGATLQTVLNGKDGKIKLINETVQNFVKAIGAPHKETWSEQFYHPKIQISLPLASVWGDYTFYLDGKLLHCGVDVFELAKDNGQWRITHLSDTRQKENCNPSPLAQVDTLLNRWHRAAAVADEDTFFGSMTEDADYIGTDAAEHWKRDELKKWSEPYFKRESAWAFTSKSRKVTFTEAGDYAWFDELLDTWMGDCRGSGILQKTADGWKIKQYVLSVAVPNDVVKPYLKLLGKKKP